MMSLRKCQKSSLKKISLLYIDLGHNPMNQYDVVQYLWSLLVYYCSEQGEYFHLSLIFSKLQQHYCTCVVGIYNPSLALTIKWNANCQLYNIPCHERIKHKHTQTLDITATLPGYWNLTVLAIRLDLLFL